MRNHAGHPFTCENSGFSTDITKGFPHFPWQSNGGAGGSYFKYPIRTDGDQSLFLEYVTDGGSDSMLWLMWYDGHGRPKISGSAVFFEHDLGTILGNIMLR